MTGNSASGGYRSKNYDEQAYDKLNPLIRRALQEAVTAYDADWCLKQTSKIGVKGVIKAIRDGDAIKASKPIQMKPGKKGHPSSYADQSCKVPILRANW